MKTRLPALLFSFALCLAAVAPALAQPSGDDPATAEAKRQFMAGTAANAARRYNEAALAFEAAASYKANAIALYAAAIAWESANAPERAADAYGRALGATGLGPQQQQIAKNRVAELEKSLGTLTIAGPEGTKVQLDALSVAPLPARLHGGPGMHVLSARSESGTVAKHDVNLELGQTTSLDVTPKAAPPPPPPKIEPKVVKVEVEGPARLSITKIAGFSLLGLGVMSGVSAIVLGLNANDAGQAYNAAPSQGSFDHANGLATWTTVAWITSGVLVAGGIVFVLLPDKKAEKTAEKGGDQTTEEGDKPAPDKHDLEVPPKEPALSLVPALGGALVRGVF